MSKTELKAKAVQLRKQGKTYSEIQDALSTKIPKSTLSYWCKDIPLPADYKKRIENIMQSGASKGRASALIANREKQRKRLSKIKQQSEEFRPLFKDKQVAKIALAMLYLGEGAKYSGHRGLMLGSSDPDIVIIYIKLLKQCYGIENKQLRARIMYRADQDIQALTKFWCKTLGLSKEQFYKTKPDSRSTGKRTRNKDYKGVCAIFCAGTDIQLELDSIARLILEE